MQEYILADLNAGSAEVSDSNELVIYDNKVVVQSVVRLLNTPVMSIPNFRQYGLDLKRFLQYPLTEDTVTEIYNYVKERVATFVDDAEILKADVDTDMNNGIIYFTFYIRVKSSNEIFSLDKWAVKVAG